MYNKEKNFPEDNAIFGICFYSCLKEYFNSQDLNR